jgi:hypothetical protein
MCLKFTLYIFLLVTFNMRQIKLRQLWSCTLLLIYCQLFKSTVAPGFIFVCLAIQARLAPIPLIFDEFKFFRKIRQLSKVVIMMTRFYKVQVKQKLILFRMCPFYSNRFWVLEIFLPLARLLRTEFLSSAKEKYSKSFS